MGAQRVPQIKNGSFFVWFVGLVLVGTRDFCSALAAVIGPVENIIFLIVHYFNSFVPIAQLGQAALLGRLSLSRCLWGPRKEDHGCEEK
jgi:hypothetical protein